MNSSQTGYQMVMDLLVPGLGAYLEWSWSRLCVLKNVLNKFKVEEWISMNHNIIMYQAPAQCLVGYIHYFVWNPSCLPGWQWWPHSASVSRFPRSFPWEKFPGWWSHHSLLCSGTGLARVIWVDKMNISCCCLGKCLLGPGEKLCSPSGADGTGWAPPPAPLVRGPGLQEAPGHLTLGWLGTRLFRLAGEANLCLALPFCMHTGKEIYGGNLGEGIVYLLKENFGKPLLGSQTSQGSN